MAAVEITISGVLYDKYSRTTRPVVLIGEASLTGVGVGGGPLPGGPGDPPGTWGGSGEPFPGWGLPGQPPRPWGGGNEPFPTPPIHLPPEPPPTGTPDDDGFIKPPPSGGGGWAYHEDYGWLYAPPGGKPHPIP